MPVTVAGRADIAHRRLVYSIDIDAELVEQAHRTLVELGYHPTLIAGDGHEGIPQHAPYDAILATCALTHVPPAWVRQLRLGGRLVAPLVGGHDAALMVLTKTADDEVTGRFDSARTSFMPLRTDLDHPLASPRVLSPSALAMPAYGTSHQDPTALVDVGDDFALFLHLHIPGLELGTAEHPTLGKTVALSDADSTAEAGLTPVEPRTWPVIQKALAGSGTPSNTPPCCGKRSASQVGNGSASPRSTVRTASTSGWTTRTARTPGHCRYKASFAVCITFDKIAGAGG